MDANRTLSQLSYGPVYEVFGDVNCLPATELDYRKRGAITEPLLLPTELQAQILTWLKISIIKWARFMSGSPSQLSYRPVTIPYGIPYELPD